MDSANNWVKVKFFRQKKVSYGEAVYVVGSIGPLGDWNPYKGLKLTWSEGDNWSGEIFLQAPCDFEYKYMSSGSDQLTMSYINWESGPNAKMAVFPKEPHSASNGALSDISVMSFNIRYDTHLDGYNAWQYRKDLVTNVIKVNGCDFIGIQEAFFNQITDLQHLLPTYSWYGRGREDGSEQGEACPIFYLNDKWQIEDGNTFWLSDSPYLAGSKTYGNVLPRICTWAKFRNKTNGIFVLIYNCHLDHETPNAQMKGAEQIKAHILENSKDVKNIILTGDFNVTPDDETAKIMREKDIKLIDTFIPKEKEDNGTMHEWTGNCHNVKIDYILTSTEFKVKDFKICKDNFKGRYPSDHFPIVAKLTL